MRAVALGLVLGQVLAWFIPPVGPTWLTLPSLILAAILLIVAAVRHGAR